MTKSIQIFKYEYAPSVATVRQKVGTRKTIKRPVASAQEFNVNELTELTTVIRNMEGFENGMLGTADYQYLKTVTRHDGKYLEDFIISYRFYINKDLKILIIGGDGDYRDQLRKILGSV